MTFYSYLWLRRDLSPYYAGKGKADRAFVKDRHKVLPPKEKWRILIYPHSSESNALEHEKFLIAIFGRKDNGTGILHNLTNGGENPPRRTEPHTEERRKRIRESNINTYRSQKIRDKISRANKGRVRSAKTRQKLSEIGKTLLGAKNPFFGKKHSEESKEKNRLAHIGKKWSAETRRKRCG